MRPAIRRARNRRMSQPVLAAWACVVAIVVGSAIGVGIAAVASADANSEPDRLSHSVSWDPLDP